MLALDKAPGSDVIADPTFARIYDILSDEMSAVGLFLCRSYNLNRNRIGIGIRYVCMQQRLLFVNVHISIHFDTYVSKLTYDVQQTSLTIWYIPIYFPNIWFHITHTSQKIFMTPKCITSTLTRPRCFLARQYYHNWGPTLLSHLHVHLIYYPIYC